MGKSQDACMWSVGLVADPHLWTFTRPIACDPRESALAWSALVRDLRRHLGFRGVRVFELHPGGHGLHVHVVADGFFSIHDVEHYTILHGWGRKGAGLDVVRVSSGETAAAYVAKYVRPQREQAEGLKMPKGVRLWASFGMPDKVLVKDVQYDTGRSRAYQCIKRLLPIPADVTDRRRRSLQFRIMVFSKVCHTLGQIKWLESGCLRDDLDDWAKRVIYERRTWEEQEDYLRYGAGAQGIVRRNPVFAAGYEFACQVSALRSFLRGLQWSSGKGYQGELSLPA